MDEVAVTERLAKGGDTIKPEQGLITVESDKAPMEIPASHGGVVTELKVKQGDKLKQGSVVVLLEAASAVSEENPATAPAACAPAAPVSAAATTSPAPVASSFGSSADLECLVDFTGALALNEVP